MEHKKKSEAIKQWLLKHDLLNIKGIERRCGIPETNLSIAINGSRDIPAKHIPALVNLLKDYGYTE